MKAQLLALLREYENDNAWWRLRDFEKNADLHDFMAWLEESGRRGNNAY